MLLFFSLIHTGENREQSTNACDIYGKIFISSNTAEADLLVYQEQYKEDAKLLVYKEKNALLADRKGLWHIVKDPALADHIIALHSQRAGSDFSIFFIDNPAFAGCNY